MTKCETKIENHEERRILILLLCINAFMFFVEITLGVLSDSASLIADSIDMLADATVYGVGLYAVGRSALIKINAAQFSGIFQVVLGVSILFDVIRRLVWGSEPESSIIVLVGIVALLANIICLKLISKYRKGEIHMRASWIFSKNDVIANLGVIGGGGLVYILDSRYPDLIIGVLISIVVIRGGIQIIKDARTERLLLRENCI